MSWFAFSACSGRDVVKLSKSGVTSCSAASLGPVLMLIKLFKSSNTSYPTTKIVGWFTFSMSDGEGVVKPSTCDVFKNLVVFIGLLKVD